MNLKNKFIKKFIIGFILGIPLCPLITYFMSIFMSSKTTPYFIDPSFVKMFGNIYLAFIVQSFISGLYSGICMGGSVVYEIEEWGIFKTTATHFLITFIFFNITGILLKWWSPKNILINVIIFSLFLIPYIIIWLSQYIIYKIELKKINKNIESFRKKIKTK